MKKLVIFVLFGLIISGSVFAQTTYTTDDQVALISASVGAHVYILSSPDVTFDNPIDPMAGANKAGTLTVRSNKASWSIKIYATNGELVKTGAITQTIQYKIDFNTSTPTKFGGSLVTISAGSIPTTEVDATVAVMTAKSASSAGEVIDYLITVPVNAAANYEEGDYTDTLHFVVVAS